MSFFSNPYADLGSIPGADLSEEKNRLNQGQADTTQQLQGIFGSNNILRDQLTNQAQGKGPNIAQDQFTNSLNQNVANEQSLIGSTRGLNPALAARMATNAGSKERQAAVSQAALLRHQQQLQAQGQLQGLNQGQGQQILALGQLGQEGQLGFGNQNVTNALGAQGIEAGAQAQNTAFGQGILGGGVGGLAHSVGGFFGLAHGGNVPNYADGAIVPDSSWMKLQSPYVQNPYVSSSYKAGSDLMEGIFKNLKGKKSNEDELSGPGGNEAGGGAGAALAMPVPVAHGGEINPDGTDDNTSNDIVKANLSPGEVVIPRSIANAPNAGDKAKAFLEAIKRQKGGSSFGKVISARKKAGK